VVFHDRKLNRVGGVNAFIKDKTYAELPLLHLAEGDAGHRIPILEEIFAAFPSSLPINLDVKEESQELVEKVHQLIRRYNREQTTGIRKLSMLLTSCSVGCI
jgi:glycerophosphoryl diester phosphodiesterase